MIMRYFEPRNITVRYNQNPDGTITKPVEDGKLIKPPYCLVTDSFSEPHASKPEFQQVLIPHFNGPSDTSTITVGEMISRTIEETFSEASPRDKLDDVLLRADAQTWKRKLNYMPEETARLAGATFAVAKINKQSISVQCTGDAFALVERHDGSIFFSKNQVLRHDRRMNRLISEEMQRAAKNLGWNSTSLPHANEDALEKIRNEMWNQFCPVLREARGKAINNRNVAEGYGALNGESRPPRSILWQWEEYFTYEIKRILLFTDGFIPWTLLGRISHSLLGKIILEMYDNLGVDGILSMTRAVERATAHTSYISHAEATIIAMDI
jgi:serine/threonine protein phosphatase PrpC